MSENGNHLLELFFRVENQLHRLQSCQFRAFGPMSNPHRGQGRVLSLLKIQPEISQKELGYLLDMRNQSLGELLNKLEKSGYITRTPSDKDRRTTNIKLTEAGYKAASQADTRQEDGHDFFVCLDEKEQSNLGEYLERLAKTLEKQLGEMGNMDDFQNRGHRHPPHPHHPLHHEHEDFNMRREFGRHPFVDSEN